MTSRGRGSGPQESDPNNAAQSHGALRPTPPAALVGWAVGGLVLGWSVRPVCDWLGVVPPLVSWTPPLALVLLAALVGYTAWATYRSVQVRRDHLEPHQAVNRLVLARACAIVGALVGAGYLGYGLSWIGDPAQLADERQLHCWAAAAGGLLTAVAAMLLERACRIRDDDPDDQAGGAGGAGEPA